MIVDVARKTFVGYGRGKNRKIYEKSGRKEASKGPKAGSRSRKNIG